MDNPSEQTMPQERSYSPEIRAVVCRNPALQMSPHVILDSNSAPARVQIERTFGILKRFRKMREGTIKLTDSPSFISDLVRLTAFVTNLIIEKKIDA